MKARKILTYLVLGIVAINLAIFGTIFLSPTPKVVPRPNPNGYDDFARAGKAINGSNLQYTNQTQEQLDKIVAANSEALKMVHDGLGKESMAPDDYRSPDYANREMTVLSSFKGLAFLLVDEGKAAELAGRTNDAVKIYLDAVRFADHSARGGVLLDKLVGIACEAIAMKPLYSLKSFLDAKQCANVASTLEEIDAKADTVDDMLDMEHAYSRKTGGIQGQFSMLIMYKSIRAGRDKAVEKFHANVMRRRQAMVAFAARAYEIEKGKAPSSASDLVPAYLKAVPKDPVKGSDLPYP